MEKTIILQGPVEIGIRTKEKAGLERGDPNSGYTECYITINDVIVHRHNELGRTHQKDATRWMGNIADNLAKV